MTRLLFTGPDGRPWVGKTLRMIDPDHARNRDLWELQTQSGLTMPAVNEFFAGERTVLGPATAVIEFLTLRTAGFMVDWDEVLDMGPGDFTEVEEPELEQAADPTSPAGDAPAGEPSAAPRPAPKASASRRSPSSPGSRSRSAAGS